MKYLLCALVGMVALIAVAFVWGLVRIRRGSRIVIERAEALRVEEIRGLVNEFVAVYKEKFSINLNEMNLEDIAKELSEKMDCSQLIKDAFEEEDFYWYGALPTGAFLGDLLCKHAGGRWGFDKEGVLRVEIGCGDKSAETYPFHKVVKHWTGGSKGDVYAYIMTASQVPELIENMDN